MNNKHRKGSKILGTILNFLLFVVFIIMLIGVYYIVQIRILNKDYANMFGYTFFEVATGSMSHTIEIGDIVVVKLTNEVNENDIIVYKEGKDFITHRLIKMNGNDLITKGDANNSEDKSIVKEQVLGQVIYIVPKVGIWRRVLLSPKIFRTSYCSNFSFKCIIYVFS